MDNITKNKDITAASEPTETPQETPRRSSAMAWVALMLALMAWAALLWFNGYAALTVALLAVISGFVSIPRTKISTKRMAITAIIAALVLIVVVSAYLIVLKIGLS